MLEGRFFLCETTETYHHLSVGKRGQNAEGHVVFLLALRHHMVCLK